MALYLTVSFGCRGIAGYAALTDINGNTSTSFQYVLTHQDGTVANEGGISGAGTVTLADLPLEFDGLYDDAGYTLTLTDPATNTVAAKTFELSCGYPNPGSGGSGGGGGGSPPPLPVLGCLAPNAFNYDAAATQDTDPTSCVFVLVDITPPDLVAAHLPIPVQLRAAPTLQGAASIVVLLLSTAASLATPDAQWTEFARLRAVCDTQARAAFDLSEAAKSLLRINPPVESGIDPSLSALLRVRYEVLDPETLSTRYEGTVGTCRALNAVQQATSGATLTSATTYTTIPTGLALWKSVATYANGVASTPVVKPALGCTAREFVWLNAAGAWDQGLFFGRHAHGTDQADGITYRDLAGADRYASRGSIKGTIQVYSDVTDWPTYRLLRGLRQSIQVYERTGPSQYVPVLMTAESFPEYVEQTDKLFQVNFTVSYPAQLIQTQ